jgi:hypothetical protein
MHRYNNQDHSMLTAMYAVENILDDAGHDVWAVNVEEEHHEENRKAENRAASGDTGRSATAGTGHGKATVAGTGRDAPILPRSGDRPVTIAKQRTPEDEPAMTERP